MMPWNDATSPNRPSHTSICSQPLLPPTTTFIAWGKGSLILDSVRQSPTPPAKTMTPIARTVKVRMPPPRARGIVRCGSRASSAAIEAPSIARKNQIANGIAANIPGSARLLKLSAPAQPLAVKLPHEKPGATTPIKTSSSKMASNVTISSKVAAMPTPSMLSVIKIT